MEENSIAERNSPMTIVVDKIKRGGGYAIQGLSYTE